MHNGLRVVAGYHEDWMAQIIRGLRRHHELQEEAAFHALLPDARHGSLMTELGAFWAYYSLWFLTETRGSEILCVEPDPNNMAAGSCNAALNGFPDRASFHQAAIDDRSAASVEISCESDSTFRSMLMLDMAGLPDRAGGRPLELLHIGAQGAEARFGRSMRVAVASQGVRLLVVSTHPASITGRGDTDAICLDALKRMAEGGLVEHSLEEYFSRDGLILWSFLKDAESVELPPLSRNTAASSLFGPHS